MPLLLGDGARFPHIPVHNFYYAFPYFSLQVYLASITASLSFVTIFSVCCIVITQICKPFKMAWRILRLISRKLGISKVISEVLGYVKENYQKIRVNPRRFFSELPTYHRVHWTYFIVVCLLMSGVFYWASTPHKHVSYTDSLFLTVSSMTCTGLNTLNLSTLNVAQQLFIFCLMIIGNQPFISGMVLLWRQNGFRQIGAKSEIEIDNQLQSQHIRRSSSDESTVDIKMVNFPDKNVEIGQSNSHASAIENQEDQEDGALVRHAPRQHTSPLVPKLCNTTRSTFSYAESSSRKSNTLWDWKKVLGKSVVGRNSAFHGLSRKDMKELRHLEYKATIILSCIVWLYMILAQLIGFVGLGWWISWHEQTALLGSGIQAW